MSTSGISLPYDVAEPSVSLTLVTSLLKIDDAEMAHWAADDDDPTVRIHQLVESWEQLTLTFELRPYGALRNEKIKAIARVISSSTPSRHAITLEPDGACWKGTLSLDRDSYRGSISVTGELVLSSVAAGSAQPRATYEASDPIRIELDPSEAPPTGSIKPRWIDFSQDADKYRELQVLDEPARKAGTSLLAYRTDTDEWHWVWNKGNPGWSGILPDRRPFGTRFNARRAVSSADFTGFIRAALILGTQSSLADFWTEKSGGDQAAELGRSNSVLLREVTDWSLRQYFKSKQVDLNEEDESTLLFNALDELPSMLTDTERAALFLSHVVATVTSVVYLQHEHSNDLAKIREALIQANSSRVERDS